MKTLAEHYNEKKKTTSVGHIVITDTHWEALEAFCNEMQEELKGCNK